MIEEIHKIKTFDFHNPNSITYAFSFCGFREVYKNVFDKFFKEPRQFSIKKKFQK